MSTIVTLTESAKEHMASMLQENSKKAVRLALKGCLLYTSDAADE